MWRWVCKASLYEGERLRSLWYYMAVRKRRNGVEFSGRVQKTSKAAEAKACRKGDVLHVKAPNKSLDRSIYGRDVSPT
jgi:hypothetical protein